MSAGTDDQNRMVDLSLPVPYYVELKALDEIVRTSNTKVKKMAGTIDIKTLYSYNDALKDYKRIFRSNIALLNEQQINRKVWRTKDGFVMELQEMDEDHVINCINYMQGILSEVDENIKSKAVMLANNHRQAEQVALQLAALATTQARTELIIAMLIEENERRKEIQTNDVSGYVRMYDAFDRSMDDKIVDGLGKTSDDVTGMEFTEDETIPNDLTSGDPDGF